MIGSSRQPSKEQTRWAIEAVCPLPHSVATGPKDSGLMTTVVVLDARQVKEPVVPAGVRSLLGKAMLHHLGQKPLPIKWVRHWRTCEVETPMPASAGESSHFDLWREQMINDRVGFKPGGPRESMRPCMLPLMAARIVGQFNDQAKGLHYYDTHDLAASFFFSNREATMANVPLGDLPGIIVELHNSCDDAAFRPADGPTPSARCRAAC